MAIITNPKYCLKCSNQIPPSITIEGMRHKTFHKRSYCYDCSPWNARNNHKLETYDPLHKECTICNLSKLRSEFSDTESRCKPCLNNIIRQKRIEFKQSCLDYLTPYCVECKYDKCIAALQFHHIDKSIKDFDISRFRLTDFEKVKKELDKCIVLCSNCHAENHFNSGS